MEFFLFTKKTVTQHNTTQHIYIVSYIRHSVKMFLSMMYYVILLYLPMCAYLFNVPNMSHGYTWTYYIILKNSVHIHDIISLPPLKFFFEHLQQYHYVLPHRPSCPTPPCHNSITRLLRTPLVSGTILWYLCDKKQITSPCLNGCSLWVSSHS